MASSKLDISLKIDGQVLKATVDREGNQERAYRRAADKINSLLAEYRNKYGSQAFTKERLLTYLLLDVLGGIYLEEDHDKEIEQRMKSLADTLTEALNK